MVKETAGGQPGVLKARNGVPPGGGVRGHTIHDWRGRDFPPARGPNPCGRGLGAPSDRRALLVSPKTPATDRPREPRACVR